MNDQDQYRRMVLTTTQFEATLNMRHRNGEPPMIKGNIYTTLYGQEVRAVRPKERSYRKKNFINIRPRPMFTIYKIDETEKWWK